jgi:O-antigen/teichoic acid export membrane protein
MAVPAVAAQGARKDQGLGHRLLTLTGGRFTRHTVIYIAGMLAVGPFSLVMVIVLTRLLVPAQYGELGVLFVFAGFATTLYNTGSLHGTFMWVYGVSEGEGDDVSAQSGLTSAPRRALGTGVVLTLMIVSAGTAVCFVFAPQLAQALLHHRSGATLVRWAAVSAAAGSLWRLTVNVFRMECRPGRFAVFNATRPLFVIAGVVPLVVLGFGTRGALAGTALGTLCASALCIAMSRHSYALAFCWSDVKKIVGLGSLVVIPVLCLYFVHSADIVLLSRFAKAHELGLYRVASRFAVIPSYFASAFLMAWAPLERGVLFRATYRHVGEERVRGTIFTYYLLAATTIVLLLDVGANVLVLLAGPSYRSAAPLIPLIGAAFVGYGLYIVLVRSVKMERRMLWYGAGAVLACLLQIGASTITIPWLGAYGAPVATLVGVSAACAMWLLVARSSGASYNFQARPLAGLLAAVAIAAGVQALGMSLWPEGRPFVLAAVLVSYAVAIVAFAVIPRSHFRPLGRLARAALRTGLSGSDPTLGLSRLEEGPYGILAAIERDGTPPTVLAEQLGGSEREVRCAYVASLRELTGAGPASAELETLLPSISAYLLSSEPEAQRDVMGHELIEKGVDPLELMELDETARRLRALPARAWPAASASATVQSASAPVQSASAHAQSQEPRPSQAAPRLQRSGVGELL